MEREKEVQRKEEQCLSTRGEEAAKYIISSKSQGQTNSTCLCQADDEWQGRAWHGVA